MRFEEAVGSWTSLVNRLTQQDTWATWVRMEPALEVAGDLVQARQMLGRGSDRTVADAVLGSLVRLAAADGGNDVDAVLVVLHLLEDGARSLAAKIAHRTRDSLVVVLGELACQIRKFPWRRRTRSYAANLLLDTKHALWVGEFCPVGVSDRPNFALAMDPAALRDPVLLSNRWRDLAVLESYDSDQVRLSDVLVWALRAGIASRDDLSLLWESEVARDRGAVGESATQRGVGERRDRRRRARTLTALQRSSSAYLAAVA